MRDLWQALTDIYGARFTSSFGVDPMKGAAQRWARVLGGFTREMIAFGVQACENNIGGWIDLPTFKARCLGIPEFYAVALEIMESRRQTTRFGRLVWLNMPGGAHLYKGSRPERQDMLLRQAYQVSCEHVMRGGALPPAVAGEIEHEDWKRDPNHPRDLVAAAEEQKRVEQLLGIEPGTTRAPEPTSATPAGDWERQQREVAEMSDDMLALALMARAVHRFKLPTADGFELHFANDGPAEGHVVAVFKEGSGDGNGARLRFMAKMRPHAEKVYLALLTGRWVP